MRIQHRGLAARLAHYYRMLPPLILRHTPLSWRTKRWIIWGLSPRYALGVHVVVTNADGEILCLRSSYSQLWQLPGGGVKYRESLTRAMRREALEETGLELHDLRLAALLHDGSGRGLQAVYRATVDGSSIRLSEEHTEWRYVPFETLSPFYRRCVRHALDQEGGGTVPVFAWWE
jgi:8-oxo-dGTP pyrophosphatase MutT (NUDIX family)